MGRKGFKTGKIYIKLYMSIFSLPSKVALSETKYDRNY